jgi:hypothetical protein
VAGSTPSVLWGFAGANAFYALDSNKNMVGKVRVPANDSTAAAYPILKNGTGIFTLNTGPSYGYGAAYSICDKFTDPDYINSISIVGAVSTVQHNPDPQERAAGWTGNGEIMLLDTLDGGDQFTSGNVAYSISHIGLVGGTSALKSSQVEQAVVWSPFSPKIAAWLNGPYVVDNPTPGGGVRDVRDGKYLAGYVITTLPEGPLGYQTPEIVHAAYWDGTGHTNDIQELSNAPGISWAYAVRDHNSTPNQRPEIVGSWDPFPENIGHTAHAYIWTPQTGMRDLNDSISQGIGVTLLTATDIAPDGRIVANGTLNGNPRGFVLVPLKVSKVPINPLVVSGGLSAQASITLSDEAPTDVVIALRSSSPYASVPATVTVPRGRSAVDFSVAPRPVRARTSVVITALLEGEETTSTLTITP